MATGDPSANVMMVLQQLANNTETAPELTMLRSAGSESLAKWQNELDDYDYRV